MNDSTTATATNAYDEVCRAAWNSNMKVLEGLLEEVRKGGVSSTGYGPTHFAASLGNVEVMEFLLAGGVDKNERDAEGNSALMWVVSADGSEDLMEALVDHGANVNLQNYRGETALYTACARGLEKVEFLLENGADVRIADLDGATPLHAAAASLGDASLIALLVRYGASVNAGDDEGDTPLHWAVREGKMEAAQTLIQLGASITQSNEDGESALELALSLDDEPMAKHLSTLGAKPRMNVVVGAGPIPGFSMTDCAPLAMVEEVHLDKDVNMIGDMAKDMRGLSVRDDDAWKGLRTVSI